MAPQAEQTCEVNSPAPLHPGSFIARLIRQQPVDHVADALALMLLHLLERLDVVGKNTRDYILAARFETGKVPAKVLAN